MTTPVPTESLKILVSFRVFRIDLSSGTWISATLKQLVERQVTPTTDTKVVIGIEWFFEGSIATIIKDLQS